jgi:DNA-binding transcriptional LysR family regulator
MGEGVALVPSMVCFQELSSGKLVRVLPDWSTNIAPISLVYTSQRFINPKVKEMLPLLEKSVQKMLAPPESG